MFTVELVSGPLGVHGQSAAQVVGGGLTTTPQYTQNLNGPAWVSAPTETEAIKLGLIGSAVVDLIPVGKPLTTYHYTPANVGSGAPAPFRIVADPANVPGAQITTWVIQLEDMAAHTGCDWDYNDHSWTVRVTNYSLPLPTGPGAISGTVWTDNTRDNQLNFANDAPKANTLVTLTTSTGGRFAETWTDANGFYAFTSLPLGDYRVRVSS